MTSAYPKVFRVRQKFGDLQIDDLPGTIERELSRLTLDRKIRPGQTVAITAGSRGIHQVATIIKTIVDHVGALGAEPFIVPAMGSHGGGTADGQQRIIESYGVTEAYCGCPIRASMETVIVCRTPQQIPVHFDRHAFNADHVIVCNRIKPHTLFSGDIESGLMKMMLIGLGKHAGAKIYHRTIRNYSFSQIVRDVTAEVLQRCSIVAGLAIVENSYGRTARIEGIRPDQFEAREKVLLKDAARWMPRLPFGEVDVLLIDQIGKNISGAGLDVNVVGRKQLLHQAAADEHPKIRMIGVRDLHAASSGNATGIGLVEFCRSRVLEKMDVRTTRINVLTGGHYTEAMSPLDYDNDGEMVEVMLSQLGLVEPPDARLMWIRDTLHLAEVECATAYLDEARRRDDLEILTDLRPLSFDGQGNLSDQHMEPAVAVDV